MNYQKFFANLESETPLIEIGQNKSLYQIIFDRMNVNGKCTLVPIEDALMDGQEDDDKTITLVRKQRELLIFRDYQYDGNDA